MPETIGLILKEGDLLSIVEDWLLSKHGMRLSELKLRTSHSGIQVDVWADRAEACSRCNPDLFLRIRKIMDSRSILTDCDQCGRTTRKAFFLPVKSEKIVERAV